MVSFFVITASIGLCNVLVVIVCFSLCNKKNFEYKLLDK